MKEKIDKIEFDESDTLENVIKRTKRGERKHIRNALGVAVGELMVGADFDLLTQQLWTVDDAKNRISHQIRSRISNNILRGSEKWEVLQEMRRNKSVDKKKIAQFVKKLLKEEGYDEGKITEMRNNALALTPIYQVMDILKEETAKCLVGELINIRIWNGFLQKVRGISVLTASKLIFMVGDVTRFSQPSKLIKYCGLAVNDGKVDRLETGVEANYKPKLKALLIGVMSDNFLRQTSQYRVIYDRRKKYAMEHRPEWGEHPSGKDKLYMAHYHNDAKRIMIKRFIIEFWKAGWLAAGKEPPTKPYAVRILGHDEEPDIVPYG